jgi:uncharacterized membrane protein
MLNPFDPKASLLAKHAQHVVLIHFPIALYLTATFLDSLSRIFKKLSAFDAVRWNFLCAAIASLPAAGTGILAWRWALAGQAFKGILRLHFLFALAAILGMWATVWVRYARKVRYEEDGQVSILVFEWCVCLLLAVAGHLGGFLSGVNGAP